MIVAGTFKIEITSSIPPEDGDRYQYDVIEITAEDDMARKNIKFLREKLLAKLDPQFLQICPDAVRILQVPSNSPNPDRIDICF